MQLEVEKTYLNREGDKVRITHEFQGKYPYRGDDGEWYQGNGAWHPYGQPDKHDLVALAVSPEEQDLLDRISYLESANEVLEEGVLIPLINRITALETVVAYHLCPPEEEPSEDFGQAVADSIGELVTLTERERAEIAASFNPS